MNRPALAGLEQGLDVFGGGLHEVAEHGVVADLQGDAALYRQPRFQGGDDLAALVAQDRASSISAEQPGATRPPSRARAGGILGEAGGEAASKAFEVVAPRSRAAMARAISAGQGSSGS